MKCWDQTWLIWCRQFITKSFPWCGIPDPSLIYSSHFTALCMAVRTYYWKHAADATDSWSSGWGNTQAADATRWGTNSTQHAEMGHRNIQMRGWEEWGEGGKGSVSVTINCFQWQSSAGLLPALHQTHACLYTCVCVCIWAFTIRSIHQSTAMFLSCYS